MIQLISSETSQESMPVILTKSAAHPSSQVHPFPGFVEADQCITALINTDVFLHASGLRSYMSLRVSCQLTNESSKTKNSNSTIKFTSS